MTQAEITKWEQSKIKAISGWEIHYGEEYDIIIFSFYNKQTVTFKRDKA
jgi:hypothetical protein